MKERAMDRMRAVVIGGVALSVVSVIACSTREDPCVKAGSDHQQMHPRNQYLSTCDGRLYLPIANDRRPYLRVDDVNVSDVEPLPFKYLKVSGQIYYVATVFEFFDETKTLLPIEGIDSATAEALDERHIRDKDNKFTVLDGQVLFERRVDR
jgi:hypothetical protein